MSYETLGSMQLTKDTLIAWYMSQKKECYCYYLNSFIL